MKGSSAQEAVDFVLAHQLISSAFLEELGSDLSRFASGEEVINELVRCGRMTEYQQSQLLSGQGEKLCFGPYRLVRPLGEGGMGEVFKAWQPRLDRFVALKFIHAEYLDEQSNALIRFQRESHAIAQLQHPNIIVLYDADEIDGVPFIAMEFVDGVSLSDTVRRSGPLGVKQACEYMRQAALGLQHAFERGFVHRDIKPSNIVVFQPKKRDSSPSPKNPSLVTTRDLKWKSEYDGCRNLDRIKILDMGLARLNGSLASGHGMVTPLTASGAVLGTPDYLAPEQARDASKVDIRADLYSLGCTFYFILSGQPLFPGGTPLEKIIKHQCDEPTPLRTLRRDLPETIARTVEKLLAKKPDDRFQTPLELANSLSGYLASAGRELELPPYKSGSTSGTLPTLIVPQQVPGSKPTTDSTNLGRSTNQESLIVLPGDSPPGLWKTMTSLDNVDLGEPDIKDLNWESVGESTARRTRKGRITPVAKLEGHVGAVSGVAVTRDGKLAATGDVNGEIRIWDLRDSHPREIGQRHRRAEIQSLVFAPDDSNYTVFGELRQGKAALVRWDWMSDSLVDWGDFATLNQKSIGCLSFATGGDMLTAGVGSLAVTWKIENGAATKRKIHKGMGQSIGAIAVSPDRLLLAAAGQHRSLHFWHLWRGRWNNAGVRVNSQITTISSMRFSPDGSLLAMAGLDNTIIIWTMAGELDGSVCVLRGHASNVQHIKFIGGNTHLASVGMDGQILFWDLQKASIIHEVNLDMALAYRVEMSEDGTRLVAGFTNGTVSVYCPDGLSTPARLRH